MVVSKHWENYIEQQKFIMPQRILNEDWSDHDDRKKRWQDRFFFSCEEDWEVDYLVRKSKNISFSLVKKQLEEAIRTCCSEIPAPRPRDQFVKCVMDKL